MKWKHFSQFLKGYHLVKKWKFDKTADTSFNNFPDFVLEIFQRFLKLIIQFAKLQAV